MEQHVFRIRLVTIGFFLFALLLGVRLYYVQVLSNDAFSERADRQYIRPVGGLFERGTIYFESKDGTLMPAALLKTGYTVAINPKLIKDPEDIYTKLTDILGAERIEKEAFLAKAGKKGDPYEEVIKRIDEEAANKIEELDISGLNIYRERWRYYPGETLASQTLGFVGYLGEDYGGRYGLEKYYESVLKRNSEDVYVNFFAEIFTDLHKTFSDTGTVEGDVVSSIEPNVQGFLEKELEATNDKFKAKLTGGIVIDPFSGEIKAMGTYPAFNPNSFQNVGDIAVLNNPLVQSVYEMGSIVKPLTVAAGLDAGVITAKTTYNDTGSLSLNNYTIYNFDKRARGVVDMQEVLNQSLNLGVTFISKQLGKERFANYMEKFGLGEETGIDLPNEAKGLTSNLQSKRDIEHATASFGQGIAMSPIAITRALSVLANGGTLITPHVIKKVEYKVGYAKEISYPEGTRVISPEASQEISRMLTKVVDDALLNGSVKMDRYSVAAKTGTAQIAKPGGGYYDDRYLHSFFGYFPATQPKYLVFMYTVEPVGQAYASQTLTEPFMNVAKYLINYYEIPPDR